MVPLSSKSAAHCLQNSFIEPEGSLSAANGLFSQYALEHITDSNSSYSIFIQLNNFKLFDLISTLTTTNPEFFYAGIADKNT